MFAGKVIAITGASEGIGAELARQMAGKGVWLALAARNLEKLEAVAQDCRLRGAEAFAMRCDVSAEADCRAFIEAAARKYSSLDILFNNAGVSGHAMFDEVTDFAWYEQMMKVNYFGSLYCTQHALPHLKKSKGQIVAISSLAGRVGVPGRTAYSPTKAAQALFHEALRLEVKPDGVDITVVYPGVVATEIRLHGYGPDGGKAGKSGLKEDKAMTVQECARQILVATHERKRQLVMTLQARIGLWLQLIAPGIVDRMVLQGGEEGWAMSAIWKRPVSVEILNAIHVDTTISHLGIEFLEVGDDFLRARAPVDARTRQPAGILHGGISVVVAEMLGSCGAACASPPGCRAVGVEVNANHLRSVSEGWVTGVTRPIHIGRSTHVWHIELTNDKGQKTCISRITMAILQPEG